MSVAYKAMVAALLAIQYLTMLFYDHHSMLGGARDGIGLP